MRPIKINEDVKSALIKDFTKYLNSARLQNNTLTYQTSLNVTNTTKKKRPTLKISTKAYLKMLLYVLDTSTEIAWHGTVSRNVQTQTYTIKDVFLYPQTLTNATVNTDQEKYTQWCEELDDDTVNEMHFQGHSHVNFGATPSGVDINYYNDVLQVLTKDDYYIFLIMNKSRNFSVFIYDLSINTIFETQDIDIIITDSNEDIESIIKKEKTQYCKTPKTTYEFPTHAYKGYQTQTTLYDQLREPTNYDIKPNYNPGHYTADELWADLDEKYKNKTLKKGK